MSLDTLDAMQVWSDIFLALHPELSPVHGDRETTWLAESGVWADRVSGTTALFPWNDILDELDTKGLLPDSDGGNDV